MSANGELASHMQLWAGRQRELSAQAPRRGANHEKKVAITKFLSRKFSFKGFSAISRKFWTTKIWSYTVYKHTHAHTHTPIPMRIFTLVKNNACANSLPLIHHIHTEREREREGERKREREREREKERERERVPHFFWWMVLTMYLSTSITVHLHNSPLWTLSFICVASMQGW